MPDTTAGLVAPMFPSFQDAYTAVLRHVADNYEHVNAPRGNKSRECLNVSFQLADPRARTTYLAARKANIVFHWAEALWYVWARNDVESIAYYAPQIRAYSGDGATLSGSAYGRRLFRPLRDGLPATWTMIRDLLQEDPETKRAVATFFRPEELAVENNLDVACILALQFLQRDGRLHAVTYMRANDAVQGLLSDVFSFTLIQELMARQLGLDLGTYTHHVGSMHIGDKDRTRVLDVLTEADSSDNPVRYPAAPMPAGDVDVALRVVEEWERILRLNEVQLAVGQLEGLGLDRYWQQVALLFEAYRQIAHQPDQPVSADTLAALEPGNRWLLAHRWPDRMSTGYEPARVPHQVISKRHSGTPGTVLTDVDWGRCTIIVLKPDCLGRGLVNDVLGWVSREVEIVTRETVTVSDAQIFAHYADIIADRDWFSVDVVEDLRRIYVGHEVVVAIGRGPGPNTARRVRALLGHYDPAKADPNTIRGHFGVDNLERSRAEGRLIENLIHSSDENSAARDFGIWFGANRADLVLAATEETTAP
ncbi:MAG: thymidylate synthase [Acidimicrobiales bacterium]